ncbi:MAG: OmpA family protein [Campylobacterota bacterium]|nr:OmpA family protein [Campylobacterota bacterium]
MFSRDSGEDNSSFWISYADLMAGLLFVFILLIGAIVSKSLILKSNLHEKEDRLTVIETQLENKEQLLEQNNLQLTSQQKDLKKRKTEISVKDEKITQQKREISFKDDEIKKLNILLRQSNTQRDELNGKIVIVQNLLDKTKVEKNRSKKSLEDYQNRVVILSSQLTDANKTVVLKDREMLQLMNALDEKETDYNKIVESLQKQKAKIKSLTGIKIKVIAALKRELGSQISIDPKSGSLRFSSNILFDKGSAELKEQAKGSLKKAFEEYISTLVTNPTIKPHLDKIVIEGHTDSDGGYLYNLDLSQQRAFAVMNYLLTLDFAQKHNIKPLIVASGRAYLDAVQVDGVEDKDASRRIEIKFRLKNEDAMLEIEKVLDAE